MIEKQQDTNKYSSKKISWFPEKLTALRDKRITAPLYVRIKPTNRCNHKCPWCVYYEPELSNMGTDMNARDVIPREKLLRTLDELAELGVRAITYSGGGEPLLHPNIEEAMQKTLDLGMDLSIITHGQYLSGKKAEILAKSKWVRVSVDYHTPEMFSKTRRLSEKYFYVIMDNIKEFSKIKNKNCDLNVNYIITKENHDTLYDAAVLLKNAGVEIIRFAPVWNVTFYEYHALIREKVMEQFELMKDLEDENFKIFSSYDIDNVLIKRPYKRCYMMEVVPIIGADLNIYPCHNQVYLNDSIICSFKDRSFKEAWFGEETRKMFETFDCQATCTNLCAADNKNLYIRELLNCEGDNFV